MANPTSQVLTERREVNHSNQDVSLKGEVQTIHVGEMVGHNSDGFSIPCDDSEVIVYQGVSVEHENKVVESGDADGDIKCLVDFTPFSLLVSGVGQDDLDSDVFALFSNEGQIAATVNSNKVGKIIDILGTDSALIDPRK